MKNKKGLWKLTGYILLVLIVCTALGRQFQQMLLPQVTAAALGAGTITHRDVYPAVAEETGSGMISWQVDEQGYEYYGENKKANLNWIDANGKEQTEVLKIVGKNQNADGSWSFTMDMAKLSSELGEEAVGSLSVTMEKKSEYDHTLPMSALSRSADGYVIYMIETEQGVFSDEQIVRRYSVTVLDQDGVNAAVSSGWADQVVTYTSKSLWDGMRVVITE